MADSQTQLTGAQCQYARTKLGLTQAQLANGVGVSRSQIANFETKGERFTPSAPVRAKLREFFESEDADLAAELDELSDGAAEGGRAPGSPVSSRAMEYVRRLTQSGCFRMSAELTEAQRNRLLEEIDKGRERMEEIAATPTERGFFAPYDAATDRLIEEAEANIREFGFLYVIAFGYGFIALPTTALLDGKKTPETIAEALALKYADHFKRIGIRKNEVAPPEDASPEKKRCASCLLDEL